MKLRAEDLGRELAAQVLGALVRRYGHFVAADGPTPSTHWGLVRRRLNIQGPYGILSQGLSDGLVDADGIVVHHPEPVWAMGKDLASKARR